MHSTISHYNANVTLFAAQAHEMAVSAFDAPSHVLSKHGSYRTGVYMMTCQRAFEMYLFQ